MTDSSTTQAPAFTSATEDSVQRDGAPMSRDEAEALAQHFFDLGQLDKVEGRTLEFGARNIRPGSEDFADYRRGYESNFSQASWEIRLSGNSPDLRRLCDRPGSADFFRIWGGVDEWRDCPNDEFSFNSSYFAQQSDPLHLISVAHELVKLFNSAAELFEQNYPKQRITGVYYKGRQVILRDLPLGCGLLGRLPVSPRLWNETMQRALLSGARLPIVLLAAENEDVQQILRFLALPADWGNYYKLLETLETYAERNGKPFPKKSAARKVFTNNANNYSVVGIGARHGVQEEGRPNPVPRLTLEQAHVFISGVCKLYLNTFYGEYFAFDLPPGVRLAEDPPA
ncbi:hypothetical protein [Pseudomonas sp. EMN2]|uniref:hypothetical protein n=1 Tax=Pseudomonas sp. EMN2 TaxID=2615212 RepID=UPI00129C0FAC|nr:hypothetical protein [Pseudomonas sp. EMN2]